MIDLRIGDITKIKVDAIVNAAKPSLLGGGGVDAAIHAAAGPELRKTCSALNGCAPGRAVITPGYNLPARYVIHTVAPRYGNCSGKEKETLRSCYLESLALADEHKLQSIAFPSLGTGAYGFPKEYAARVSTEAALDFLSKGSDMHILFVIQSDQEFDLYTRILSKFGIRKSKAT